MFFSNDADEDAPLAIDLKLVMGTGAAGIKDRILSNI